MKTTSWRSAIWQKLFSRQTNSHGNHDEKLHGRDEEAHELLPSSSGSVDGEDNKDREQPYADDEEKAQRPKQSQPETSDLSRHDHHDSCVGRRASLIAITILLLFLIAGLGIISSSSGRDDIEPSPAEPASGDNISNTSLTTTSIPSHHSPTSAISPSIPQPRHPILRRSWTSLGPMQKHSYISALKCLRRLPPLLPRMPTNASSYSDYPYVHAHIGYRTHNSASFLPWHRYFLHLYEQRLRESCGYDGGIPYWDWSADADDVRVNGDLSRSAVFNPTDGFGGDGAADGPITVGRHGQCVDTGHFAGLEVLWYDVKYQPHCLSRGFRTDGDDSGENKVKIDGSALTSPEINKILASDNYEAFVGALEKKVHDVIPFGVGGDFETFSAPFEPLFWLHHANLDRLWAVWQGGRREKVFEYAGHRYRHSIEQASLEDMLEMGGVLGVDVAVRDVMSVLGGCGSDSNGNSDSDGGILCVGYV